MFCVHVFTTATVLYCMYSVMYLLNVLLLLLFIEIGLCMHKLFSLVQQNLFSGEMNYYLSINKSSSNVI